VIILSTDSCREGILVGNWHTFLSNDMNMYCIFENIVPRMVLQEQCDNHMRMDGELVSTAVIIQISSIYCRI
jgi:hypothetical protein